MYLTPVILVLLLAINITYARETEVQKIVSIPLTRIYKHGSYSVENINKSLSMVRSLKNGGEVTLKDFKDMYYYGPIKVGTPGQLMYVDYDTGSSDLWVASRRMCKRYPHYCRDHDVYDHTKSKTYLKDGRHFKIEYGSGSVDFFVSKDNIEIAGLPVKGQLFGEATAIDYDTKTMEIDGILGLAYPSLSEIESDPPFVNMVKQGVVKDPVFAFYLNKDEPPSKNSGGNASAVLVFGGVDPNHFVGNFTYVDVFEKSYWNIYLDSLWLGPIEVGINIPAIPDSGTSVLVGPQELIDPINEAIGVKYWDTLYTVDCSTVNNLPDVTFVISNVKFVLQPRDYIITVNSDNSNDVVCTSGFRPGEQMSMLILGDVFMRKYYTVFDMGKNRVGFALAK